MSTMVINNPFNATQINSLSGARNKAVQSAIKQNGTVQQPQNLQKAPELFKKISNFFKQFSLKSIEEELRVNKENSKLVQKLAKFFNHAPGEVLAKINKTCTDVKAFSTNFKAMLKNCKEEVIKFAKSFKR